MSFLHDVRYRYKQYCSCSNGSVCMDFSGGFIALCIIACCACCGCIGGFFYFQRRSVEVRYVKA